MNTIIPRMSEKAFALSQKGAYVFIVPLEMNRVEVARTVEAQYDVKVTDVKIAIIKGKATRFIRKGGRVNTGVRTDIKKAFVRLQKGQSLPIFAAIEEEVKEVEKTEKADKPEQKKRNLFGGRKNEKATKAVSSNVSVARTQAKVGEK